MLDPIFLTQDSLNTSETYRKNGVDVPELFITIVHELTHASYASEDLARYSESTCIRWAKDANCSREDVSPDYSAPFMDAGCVDWFFREYYALECSGGTCD